MFTLDQIFNKVISIGAEKKLSDMEFVEAELTKWLNSPERQMMIAGDRYYNGDHDILSKQRTVTNKGKTYELEGLPNNKIVDNLYRKMVIQKVNYLLGRPFTLTTDKEDYLNYLYQTFNRRFDRTLKSLLTDAINGGKAWMFVGYDGNGELTLRKFKPYEVKAFWADSEHTILECAVRVYDVVAYEGTTEKVIQKVELYDAEGIRFYDRIDGRLVPADPYAQPYITVSVDDNIEGYNWAHIPLICFKYNDSELPLIKSIKSLQDGINRIESSFEDNMEEDARNTILILVNYDGQDLGEFRRNLAQYGVVKVRSDGSGAGGGVDSLQVEVNAENYKAILQIFKKALVENAMGYDMKDESLGNNPNEMNIQSMYSDIDLDADSIELEFQAALEELLWFVNCHLFNRGRGDWSEEYVEFTFNRNTRSNEAEKIQNIRNSVGIVSNRTLLAHHPYVDDVEEELGYLAEEQQVQVDDMGFMRGKPAEDIEDDE